MEATSSSPILSLIQNGAGAVARFFSGVTEVFSILNNGNVGVGTSTPSERFTVAGNTLVTGTTTLATTTISTLNLSTALTALNGGTGLSTITENQLLIGGAGNTWTQVATSSLGLGDGTFLGLSDTPNSYTANRLLFTNSGATGLTDSANLTFDGSTLNVTGGLGVIESGTSSLSALQVLTILTAPSASSSGSLNYISHSLIPAFTGLTSAEDVFKIIENSTISAGGSISATRSGRVLDISRSLTAGSSDSVLVTGSVGTIADSCTNGSGTCTSSANVLEILQSATMNTGSALNITTASTNGGLALRVNDDGTLTDTTAFVVDSAGNVGIGTSTPGSKLTIAGDIFATGAFRDSTNASGTSGMVLQSTGAGTAWVATSTLGFGSSFSTSAQLAALLSDETGTGLAVFNSSPVFDTQITTPSIVSTTTLAIDSAATAALNIGTGASAKTITFGNVTGATALNFNTGSGGSTFTTTNGAYNLLSGTGAINLGTDAAAKTITIGNGTGATSLVLNAGTGAINIGTNAIARTTTIGNTTGASGLVFNSGTAGSVFSSGNVGIGTTTPAAKLSIKGTAGTADVLNIASSTGSTTLALLANGDLELPGQLISAGIEWTSVSAGSPISWTDVTYGNGLFVAVAEFADGFSATTSSVMTSPDGINWTTRIAPSTNAWRSVIYGNGLFVAVANSGTNRVMTSPDGITWTARSAAAANTWQSVTYGNGLFVAVSSDGTNRVMTSPDGITWSPQSAANTNTWKDVVYGRGLFVAVANGGGGGTTRVMTSPDGLSWTTQTTPTNGNVWTSITYGAGLFVVTSCDDFGATVCNNDNQLTTSPDGINWTIRQAPASRSWKGIAYGDGIFVGVSDYASGGTNRVMTSGYTLKTELAHNNIYQGGTSFMGGLRAGTTTSSIASIFLQSQGGINPFAIASSTGDQLLTLTQTGNLGLGSSTPTALLTVAGTANITGATTLGSTLGVTGLSTLSSLLATNATTTNLAISGALYDGHSSAGTAGMILQSTGTSTQWIATSTLGLGNGTFLGLSDTPASYTANRVLFTNSGASAVTDDADFVFDGTNLGLGSTTPSARLSITGVAGQADVIRVASSTGSTTLVLLASGNLGLGTTTPESALAIQRLNISGSTVAGIDQYLAFTNSVASAVQYANKAYIKTTNTATTTLVGGIIRLEDSTTFGNTVRGFEVQTERGNNTLGENTAISGFARTLGVRGVTEGDAGAVYEPAGVYGETQGTTQGDSWVFFNYHYGGSIETLPRFFSLYRNWSLNELW
jgi:hypothetical protein